MGRRNIMNVIDKFKDIQMKKFDVKFYLFQASPVVQIN